MALIVETGAGLPDADSYVSLAYVADRLTTLGRIDDGALPWSGLDDTAREAACRRATEFIDFALAQHLPGHRRIREQALSFPRYEVAVDGHAVYSDEVPEVIRMACVEAAQVFSQDLDFQDVTKSTGGTIKAETVKLGPLTVSTTFDEPASQQSAATGSGASQLSPSANLARLRGFLRRLLPPGGGRVARA